MKHWNIKYAVRYVNGKQQEFEKTVRAQSITIALAVAINSYIEPAKDDPGISEVVIWNIGIVEDDVF